MTSFELWAIDVFANHRAVLRKKKLGESTIDSSVQVSGMFTISFPLLVVVVAVAGFILPPLVQWSEVQTPLVVTLLVLVFGLSGLTDRIYDRNKDTIRNIAEEIENSPGKGTVWAVRRLLKVYLISLAVVGIATILVKSIV